jgi:molybdate transport system substrate-binding protein
MARARVGAVGWRRRRGDAALAVAACLAAAVAAAAGAGGCGGDGGRPLLEVSAAASLKVAFERYGAAFGPARASFSFAGSDELAAQIRQGASPDVFAAANTSLPGALHRAGRVERPVPFAANRLVLAVPAGDRRVRSLADAARPGAKLAIGAPSVPIGAYTRQVLARLGAPLARRILANVRSADPDVASVAARLEEGAADAGFVYVTDVRAAGGRLRALALPARVQPRVVYAAAVVRGAAHPAQARAFVRGLLAGAGRRALLAAGFEPPPR